MKHAKLRALRREVQFTRNTLSQYDYRAVKSAGTFALAAVLAALSAIGIAVAAL